MAAKKPMKLKRVADAFEEVLRIKSKPCAYGSSSGSNHWPSGGSLSDLVNSFIQKVDDFGDGHEEDDHKEAPPPHDHHNGHQERDHRGDQLDDSDNSIGDDIERKELLLLKRLLGCGDDDDDNLQVEDDDNAVGFRRKITQEIEVGFQDQIMNRADLSFKRRLMVHLRQRGYDAGLCKSRWEKTGRYPAGTYEYVDIITGASSRYIVEVFLAGQFEIARPTERYTALLQTFPPIFVGKPESLKQIVRLMSAAMKESLKSNALQVAPWRRNGYLQAKWFAPYKRTTNAAPARKDGDVEGSLLPAKSKRRPVVGFEEKAFNSLATATANAPARAIAYDCRREFASKGGVRIGLLTAAFQGK